MNLADTIRRMTAPFERRLRAMCTRVLIRLVDDSAGVQVVQVTGLAGERLSDVQRLQQFGFSGRPPAGATAVMVCIGGSRTHPVVIACDHGEYRFTELAEGDSVQYDTRGNYVLITADECIVKHSTKVVSDAPMTHCKGDAQVDGNANVAGDLIVGGNITAGGAVQGATVTDGTIDLASHTHPAGAPNTGPAQ